MAVWHEVWATGKGSRVKDKEMEVKKRKLTDHSVTSRSLGCATGPSRRVGGGGWSTRPCKTEIGQGQGRKAQDERKSSSSQNPPNFRVSAPRPKFDIGIDIEAKDEAMAV